MCRHNLTIKCPVETWKVDRKEKKFFITRDLIQLQDQASIRVAKMHIINPSTRELTLKITYSPKLCRAQLNCLGVLNESLRTSISGPALVSILLGCSVFLVSISAVTCFCYKRRDGSSGKQQAVRGPRGGRPLAFTRRPAAVRSPANNSHYLKKTPSPTSRPPSASPLVRNLDNVN
ncbi:unnamed protein product [Nesidiocoris tenuis]|uniref:Uncharacterized protein n=1 Tax=Nesidiocoris tenuis TaxID=355587 RepID=A0A6H5G1K4_9HEMI|nr:unnamed protein product [Nesidiocoris tenuis]CAA9996240.1 unnamed protein product [Nesidiocoris tenuis]